MCDAINKFNITLDTIKEKLDRDEDLTIDELIRYHELMAIEACESSPRVFSVSMQSIKYLDILNTLLRACN